MTLLQQSIIKTIAYFDIFEYPLTVVEIYKWLYKSPANINLSEVYKALDELLLEKIEVKNGFYFLKNRGQIVATRLQRYRNNESKFKVGLRAAWFLRHVPFVELVAICNNVGYNNSRIKSDVDFFIITKHNRLWWTRLTVTLLVHILGMRRHDQHEKDRVCLSFYIADSSYDISGIALEGQDPYLVYWFSTLAPIFDRHSTYQNFLGANRWLKSYLPNLYSTKMSSRRCIKEPRGLNWIKRVDEVILSTSFGQRLEDVVSKIQNKKLKRYFGDVSKYPSNNVVINNSMLKFHKTDRRKNYCQKWQDACRQLGI